MPAPSRLRLSAVLPYQVVMLSLEMERQKVSCGATDSPDAASRPLAGLPDARQLSVDVMRHDRGRVRLLAACSILFWLLATAGLLFLVFGLHRLVIFIRVSDFPGGREASNQATSSVPSKPGLKVLDGPEPRAVFVKDAKPPYVWEMLHGTEMLHHGLWIVAGAIVSLLLAALFTVLLVFSSRRATLRQINISLMEISEQLKQLRRPAPA